MPLWLIGPEHMIYESPDGGETVYVRDHGSGERRLHRISDRKKEILENDRRTQIWNQIHQDARQDTTLRSMLEQVEVYWRLRYADK